MRTDIPIAMLAALLGSPAAAQMAPGGATSMSAIPGTTLPGSEGPNSDDTMRALNQRQDADRQRQESYAYRENLRIRREQAEQYAAAARNGVPLPADAADTLRRELAADIEQWRAEFGVDRRDWQAMRDQWLVDRGALTAIQWAQRRVDWWSARDVWVAAHHR